MYGILLYISSVPISIHVTPNLSTRHHITPHFSTVLHCSSDFSTFLHIFPHSHAHCSTLFHISPYFSTFLHISQHCPHVFTCLHMSSRVFTSLHISSHFFSFLHISQHFPTFLHTSPHFFLHTFPPLSISPHVNVFCSLCSPPLQAHIRIWDAFSLITITVVGSGFFQQGITTVGFSGQVENSIVYIFWMI